MRSAVGRALRRFAEKDGRGYPDWAVRYKPVVRRLNRSANVDGAILEIGATENGLARFIHRPVIAADVEWGHLQACRATQNVLPVCADIAALPFSKATFDVIVSMDTLEHVSELKRHAACLEIARVLHSWGHGAIAFPSGDGAARAEAKIREGYLDFSGEELKWLEEHVANQLPDANRIEGDLMELCHETHTVRRETNANVHVWIWMWKIMMCGWPGRANALFQAVLRLFTPILSRIHFGPCYRTVLWLEPRRREPTHH